jgi:hypothetical protein
MRQRERERERERERAYLTPLSVGEISSVLLEYCMNMEFDIGLFLGVKRQGRGVSHPLHLAPSLKKM